MNENRTKHHQVDADMFKADGDDLNHNTVVEDDESAESGTDDHPVPVPNDLCSTKQAEQQELLNHQLRNNVLARQHQAEPRNEDEYDRQRQKIIDKAREYQQELYERAKDDNIIAVLDTGMGKTLIAVMLIRDALDKDLIDTANGASQKSVFFLANRLVYPSKT